MWYKNKPLHKAKKTPDGLEQKEDVHNVQTLTQQSLQELFKESKDVKFLSFQFNTHTANLTYCEGLINMDMLNQVIPERLNQFFSLVNKKFYKEDVMERLHLPSVSCIINEDQAVSEVFEGKLLLDLGIEGTIFTVDISDIPKRSPEETNLEVSILGPRDNFIEDITVKYGTYSKTFKNKYLNE